MESNHHPGDVFRMFPLAQVVSWQSLPWLLFFLLHVSSASAGTEVAVLDAEKFDEMDEMMRKGRSILGLKKYLSHQLGVSRFRQRILHGSAGELCDKHEIYPPLELQLVILDFWPSVEHEDAKLISACVQNEVEQVVEMLQRPQDPDTRDIKR
jgi:hypothetical protein